MLGLIRREIKPCNCNMTALSAGAAAMGLWDNSKPFTGEAAHSYTRQQSEVDGEQLYAFVLAVDGIEYGVVQSRTGLGRRERID